MISIDFRSVCIEFVLIDINTGTYIVIGIDTCIRAGMRIRIDIDIDTYTYICIGIDTCIRTGI